MSFFGKYRHIAGLLVLAGIILIFVLRFSTVFSMATNLYKAFSPLLIGAIIAFILDIIVIRYERHYGGGRKNKWIEKTRKPVCIFLALISVFIIVSFVMYLAIPQVVHSLGLAVQGLPEIYADLSAWSEAWLNSLPFNPQNVVESLSLENIVGNITKVGSEWGAYIVKSMGNFVGFLFDLVIGLIFAIYILINKEELKIQFSKLFSAYLPDKRVAQFAHVMEVAFDTFSSFFVGQFLDALILGGMVTTGCFVLGIPYASNIGCVIGLTALIPLFGAYLGGTIGLIMLLTIDPFYALLFLIVLVVMQQIEGNFIYPRIVGGSIGLPGIWVFAAVAVGGSLYGVLGILFSVPLVATAYKLLREDVYRRLGLL